MGIYIPDKLIEELRSNPMDAWDLLEHDDAVTVKTPHGRLIDEDAFSDMWSGNHIGDEDEGRYHDAQWIYRDEVDKVPTVIEAEVE